MTTTTAARAAAAIASGATAAAAVATESGRSLFFTTDEGHANHREENRDTQDNDTVHSEILHLPLGTLRRNTQVAVNTRLPRNATA
jgi:hypothetical protein